MKNRSYSEEIIWKENSSFQITADWSSLKLQIEYIPEEKLWSWVLYDKLRDFHQVKIDESNNGCFVDLEGTKEKVEAVSREYLTKELVSNFEKESDLLKIELLIKTLKKVGHSPISSMLVLIRNLGLKYSEAKELVFDSDVWKGAREQSELLGQMLFEVALQDANEVEYDADGKITSVTVDLTEEKDESD
ncbi:hypothetical protein [Flammeovirga aprica]|uniref:Uncharacterized protein n=1 Tax=Flammeovirga aprica JL-4 TaxID=694437 RepID=A0A7X9XCT9_9BACT|nr:hypothetical protein [Flammeovirga aprica]NME72088.1 hypothetical protein [Flammeovirga aprica JL-4]